jgi:N-acetyl-anhydromuramyl-L-alanine amidase AmpD
MKVKYIQTKNISRWINTCEYIIVHHSAWRKLWDINWLTWWTSRKISSHYYVSQDWEVYQFAKDKSITWHAGRSEWKWKKSMNKYSIGIELESIDWLQYTDRQRSSCISLIKEISKRNKISHKNILRHKDISPKRKWDVWPKFYEKYWNWGDFQNLFNDLSKMDKTQVEVFKIMIKLSQFLWNNFEDSRWVTPEIASLIRDYLEENEVDTDDTH